MTQLMTINCCSLSALRPESPLPSIAISDPENVDNAQGFTTPPRLSTDCEPFSFFFFFFKRPYDDDDDGQTGSRNSEEENVQPL